MTREEQDAKMMAVINALPAEKRRVALDIAKRGDDNAHQEWIWVQELASLVESLTSGGSPSWLVVKLFWVRLHGVVTELREMHERGAALAATMTPEEIQKNYLKYILPIHQACCDILRALDEKEVVLVDYFRHRSCHLRQHSYALKLHKNNNVGDARAINHLGKSFSIEEIDRFRADLLARHGGIIGLGVHIAHKVQAPVARLYEALLAFHSLPPY